ncbi:GAF domain-containing protein [Streptomyces rubradiris]|uniref:Histidine kinase n=1 Tax=Streptomyces rubradiris TaxID=285531 RepID=A0ABQ3RA66_STRRR|nr:GAF domain-containing protein [Streptomyces rubradiris]GHH25798.1 histidine kinase [Streptomyces rubradiris]GHI52741.1 histidine kinase [Streptomyces rubradiris]
MNLPPLPARQPDSPTLPLHARSPHNTAVSLSPVAQATELAQRSRVIDRLGLPTEAHPAFDEIARQLSERTGFLYGIVNVILERQNLVGLHQPPPGSGYVILGRTMELDHGWCPEVMNRRKALPLPDVYASPRFASNPVVDAAGIRAYFGVPLITDDGTCIGTACVIDPEKRPQKDARRTQNTVKELAREILALPAGSSGR